MYDQGNGPFTSVGVLRLVGRGSVSPYSLCRSGPRREEIVTGHWKEKEFPGSPQTTVETTVVWISPESQENPESLTI